ncbi:MAG: hypothetical protein KAI79_18580, partial [Bacteroidales bacterium]|nr:hypothetical protein [Bacteroidales bacterium]
MINLYLKLKKWLFDDPEYFYKKMYEMEIEKVKTLAEARKKDKKLLLEYQDIVIELSNRISEPETESLSKGYLYARSSNDSFFEKIEEFQHYDTWRCTHGNWTIDVFKDTGTDVHNEVGNFQLVEYYDNSVDFTKAYESRYHGMV